MWQKKFVVYHIKSKAYLKGYDLVGSAKRAMSSSNRKVGLKAYAYATWDDYWAHIAIK